MKKTFLLLFSIFCLSSCEKDVEFNDAAMQAKIDGAFWKSDNTVAARTSTGGLTIVGDSNFGQLKLNTSSVSAGTYYLGTLNSSNRANLLVKNNEPGAENYETYLDYGPTSNVILQESGAGYTTGTYETSSINGDGLGLVVEVAVDNTGAIIDVTIVDTGFDYVSGEVVTILGGDGNAVLEIENLSISSGEIEITAYDGSTITGKFKFTALNDFGEIKTIRDGIFYKVPVN
jgi:hypothetical protein